MVELWPFKPGVKGSNPLQRNLFFFYKAAWFNGKIPICRVV